MKIPFAILTLGIASISHDVAGFSLLGPFQNQANGAPDPWQGRPYDGRPAGLGYSLSGDIGGPMFLDEGYRWNIPVITYGFAPSFVEYFGQAGVDEVEKAIAILNALPSASEMSATMEEFPLEVRGENLTADSLGLFDLKSHALSMLLEQMGLATPERFVWSLRTRNASPSGTNYVALNLNYDPVTWRASSYVNKVLYHYRVFDDLGPRGEEWASAVEWFEFDPLYLYAPYSSVAAGLGSRDFQMYSDPASIGWYSGLWDGLFFTALTRDDVGGLRFLLSRENRRWEALLPGVMGTGLNEANYVNVALRPGVEKLTFRSQLYDPVAQQFHSVTNVFSDIYFTNDLAVTQTVQRVVTTPDILFQVSDLGGSVDQFNSEVNFFPHLYERSGTSNWVNHAVLNDQPGSGGPGVIRPPVQFAFNKLGRYGVAAGGGYVLPQWGAFDGSDLSPVFFPGNETNINSLVVETRLVQTNNILEFEWTTLKRNWHRYRVEVSTNLTDWTLLTTIEPNSDWGNAFTSRQPVGPSPRFFRSIKEPWMPPQ